MVSRGCCTRSAASGSCCAKSRCEVAVVIGRWWHQRTLHARLSLLVAGAVAVAIVTLGALGWAAVFEILHRQIRSELAADASAIAAQPDRWRAAAAATLPSEDHGPDGGR